MSDTLKRLLIRNPFLARFLFLSFKIKSGKRTSAISKQRKAISLFDYRALSQDIPYGPTEIVIDNNLYGHAEAFKTYAGVNRSLPAYIEHGLFWGGMVHKDQQHWYLKKVVTFGTTREEAIKDKLPQNQAICIGPYIHYAQPLLDEDEIKKLKAELGRTLLVFPSHSLKNVSAKYDFERFIEEINRIKKDFDTVLVSLYFIDALNPETVEIYTRQGFRIVTSGHRYDHNFIARQKTIILLADHTMSNDVGTHIGYCTYMKKPHYMFRQSLSYVANSLKEQQRFETVYEREAWQKANRERDEVAMLFSTYLPNEITDEQKKIVEKYWGTDKIKSPQELRAMIWG